MRHSHRLGPWMALAGKLSATAVIGLIASGGIVAMTPASAAFASTDISNPNPPTGPEIASATSTGLDIPAQQPPPPGPKTVVVGPPGNGGDPGPKTVVVGPPGSDGGPKDVVIGGTGTDGPGPKTVVVGGPGPGDGGPKVIVIP